MSQAITLILLPQTAYVNPGNGAPYTVTGNSQPAASYYLGNQDLQTVQYSLTNCTGNIIIEASLASSPIESDWFKVFELEANANAPASSPSVLASDSKSFVNIDGNFVFLRAKVEDFKGGSVNFVKVSY